MANSPTTVPNVLKTLQTNPKAIVNIKRFISLIRALNAGKNASFFIFAEADGGVLGFSLKKKIITIATTVPKIA